MAEPEDTLRESPIDFDSAVAYALHPEMRRLLILYVVGSLFVSLGLSMFLDPVFMDSSSELVREGIGLIIGLVGATFLFGGLIGAAFKLVTDANIVAEELYGD